MSRKISFIKTFFYRVMLPKLIFSFLVEDRSITNLKTFGIQLSFLLIIPFFWKNHLHIRKMSCKHYISQHLQIQRMSYSNPNHKNPDYRKSIQRAQQEIRYHQPLQRLERRSKFHKLMKERFQDDTEVLKKDNFLIFDAIVKRGGYKEVCNHNRWQEINISMQYQKKLWGISKYYEQILLAHEEWLRAQMDCYEDVIEYQFIEMHLLTPNNLTAAYYQLTPAQYMFAESNYFSKDEYYNLKTLALIYSQIPAVPIQYADKFMILRRRLLFTQQVRPASIKQLSNFGINNNSENKVIIIGFSLSSLIIADTLAEFGIHVIIIDKNKNETKYLGKRQIIDYGLTLLEGHKAQGSYHTYLNSLEITVEQFNGICGLLDEEGKLISQEKVRVSEQHFMSIVEQMKSQVMNKKKLYEEIISRAARKKWEHEKSLIRWHYDRYILFNRLKGESTTVGDIATYQNKKFVKHLTQPYSIGSLKNINKLYEKIKNKKNVEIVAQAIDHISYNDSFWNVHTKNESFSGKYLIYSDQESICKSVLQGSPRLADIGSDILGQSAVVLQYLTVLKYINCHYVFRDKLVLKDNLKGMNCFTLNSIYGYIYFFIMPSNNEVLAVLRCYHQTSINYFTELLVIFENKCIAKTNKMIGQQSWNFDYSFSLKDQKFIEMLIRVRPNQKMYIMLPITSTHCSHPLQTQIDITTHISNLILQEIYPNYTYYNPSLTAHLKQTSTLPKSQQSLSSQRVVNAANQNNSSIFSQQVGIKNSQHNSGIQVSQYLPQLKSLVSRQKKQSQIVLQGLKLQKKELTAEECNHIFGLNHQIIKNYISQVQNKFSLNSPKTETKIQSQWFQELHLQQNLLLYSFGQPFLKKKEWFNETLGIEDTELFYPLDRMVTRREYFSLKNSLKTTTYYQIVVVVNYNVYYCIAEESQPQTIYFHNQLTILLNKLNQTLCKLRQEQIQEDQSRKNNKIKRIKITPHPPKCLSPAMIAQIVQEQITNIGSQQKLEDLLNQKFSNTLSSSYSQRFMVASNQVQHVSPAPFSDTILVSQLLDIDTRVSIIVAEMLNFRDKISMMASLKHFSLFQLFFGILNQQYICCEIMNKFAEKPYDYHQIQSQDSQLCQEIRQVFSKSVTNQQYSIFIVPEPGSVAIKRNFIDRKNQNQFQAYCYLHEMQNQSIKHYLIMGKHKINFRDREEIMTYILKSLVINHHNSAIVKHFQEMLRQDVNRQLTMSAKLKLYYLMTKKQIKKPINGNSAAIFSQKCKDLNSNEKHELAKLMRSNKIRWIDNDFLYVVK